MKADVVFVVVAAGAVGDDEGEDGELRIINDASSSFEVIVSAPKSKIDFEEEEGADDFDTENAAADTLSIGSSKTNLHGLSEDVVDEAEMVVVNFAAVASVADFTDIFGDAVAVADVEPEPVLAFALVVVFVVVFVFVFVFVPECEGLLR